MLLLDMAPKWLLFVLVGLLVVITLVLQHEVSTLEATVSDRDKKLLTMERDHAEEVSRSLKEYADNLDKTHKDTLQLQRTFDADRRKINAQVANLADTNQSLRLRFTSLYKGKSTAKTCAQSTAAGASKTTGECNDPELSNPIGRIIDEATRADKIRLELLACYKAYDSARAKLSEGAMAGTKEVLEGEHSP